MTCLGDTPGVFPRPIEPSPANLEGLCVELGGAPEPYDVAFVTDCDNDRCVLIAPEPDTGVYEPLDEDLTFAITVDQALSTYPHGQTVVTNWSTSQMIKDICSAHHANLRRVPTGEVFTSGDALHFHAAIAGEGSCAGVIDPRVGMGRDVLVAIWHVLAALARSKTNLACVTQVFPKYARTGRDLRIETSAERIPAMIEQLKVYYAGKPELAFLSREDGLIAAFRDNSRVQVRASNTEPLLRVRSWARDAGKAQALTDEAIEAIRGYV